MILTILQGRNEHRSAAPTSQDKGKFHAIDIKLKIF